MSEQANVHLFGLFCLVISFLDRVPPAQMFKNGFQEYAQKKYSFPVYHIVNDGSDHLPQFKCSVTINGKNMNPLLVSAARRKHRMLQLRKL